MLMAPWVRSSTMAPISRATYSVRCNISVANFKNTFMVCNTLGAKAT